jgi:hypothetical protein
VPQHCCEFEELLAERKIKDKRENLGWKKEQRRNHPGMIREQQMSSRLGSSLPPPNRLLVILITSEPRGHWEGRLRTPASPFSRVLLFRKSLNPTHTYSRITVHTDKDLHPTITDEICIDSKIKSNEKKIGSQPDPTVPDCCIGVAKRHFVFYCLQISI